MPETCLNCGAALTGPFCAQCGQEALAARASIGSWAREMGGEVFSLEGKTLRTARDLFKPGRLSIDWAEGRRARHLSPSRVFLLASLAFFSVAFLLGPMSPQEGARAFNDDAVAAVARRTATEIVVLAVPVVALTLALVLFRKRRFFIEHLVFALHVVAVGLLLLAIAWALAHALTRTNRGGFALVACGVVTFVWLGTAVRRFYGTGVPAAIGAVVAIIVGLGLVSRPLAEFADGRMRAYELRRDAETRRRAAAAYDASRRESVPLELRRAAAAQSFAAYLELDQRAALTDHDRPRFACLALELDMPAQAAAIDPATARAGCPAGL